MGRKSNVCDHNNWGVPIMVLTSVNNAPWCVVRKSLLYPPIELHGHRGSAWRVFKCVPLVTDLMGSVCLPPQLLSKTELCREHRGSAMSIVAVFQALHHARFSHAFLACATSSLRRYWHHELLSGISLNLDIITGGFFTVSACSTDSDNTAVPAGRNLSWLNMCVHSFTD
jgi:hypothetical protein